SKGTGDHRVAKVTRAIERRDSRRQPLPHAEMPRLPSHGFVEPDQSSRHTSDRAFTTRIERPLMQVDASGKIEAPIDRRSDIGDQLDCRHEKRG
ncbi:MAG TPA: hypothetical protein VJR24_16640, partial [Gemmatimonadaceae bacterium]|nr:hypothetical protein [Gemmatimonadaceae bacterium]